MGRCARACALKFTLIGMYKENMRGILRTQRFIHLDFFVRTHIYSFVLTQCFTMNSTQVFVHEAPGVCLTRTGPQRQHLSQKERIKQNKHSNKKKKKKLKIKTMNSDD